MTSEKIVPKNIVDILITHKQKKSFATRISTLGLSSDLEIKCNEANSALKTKDIRGRQFYLTPDNEKELATEVLLRRHQFTELVCQHQVFRQAALSVIQNIYLSQDRRIFFDRGDLTAEQERQAALHLFGSPENKVRVPLGRTFQHLILARIWYRILLKMNEEERLTTSFQQLHSIVEQLNDLRNIYILLTTGLVSKLTSQISSLYRQSITPEDAQQIGSFGVARAAYRYHPRCCGGRFSTFASFWVMREVQKQALGGRLIRVPTTLVEQLSKRARRKEKKEESLLSRQLHIATLLLGLELDVSPPESEDPAARIERQEQLQKLFGAIDLVLSPKSADVIKRRYGLGKYRGKEQSAVTIARVYGVTRGSVYQLEHAALEKLKKHFIAKGY